MVFDMLCVLWMSISCCANIVFRTIGLLEVAKASTTCFLPLAFLYNRFVSANLQWNSEHFGNAGILNILKIYKYGTSIMEFLKVF